MVERKFLAFGCAANQRLLSPWETLAACGMALVNFNVSWLHTISQHIYTHLHSASTHAHDARTGEALRRSQCGLLNQTEACHHAADNRCKASSGELESCVAAGGNPRGHSAGGNPRDYAFRPSSCCTWHKNGCCTQKEAGFEASGEELVFLEWALGLC